MKRIEEVRSRIAELERQESPDSEELDDLYAELQALRGKERSSNGGRREGGELPERGAITVRLRTSVREHLEQVAEDEGVSVNSVATKLIRDGLSESDTHKKTGEIDRLARLAQATSNPALRKQICRKLDLLVAKEAGVQSTSNPGASGSTEAEEELDIGEDRDESHKGLRRQWDAYRRSPKNWPRLSEKELADPDKGSWAWDFSTFEDFQQASPEKRAKLLKAAGVDVTKPGVSKN